MGISIENLKPGMGLVVLRGPMVRTPIGAYGLETEFLEDRTWQGCLLIVCGVSAPYVACRVFHPGSVSQHGKKKDPGHFYIFGVGQQESVPQVASIDVRRYELGVASREFMAAFVAQEMPGPKPGQLPA